MKTRKYATPAVKGLINLLIVIFIYSFVHHVPFTFFFGICRQLSQNYRGFLAMAAGAIARVRHLSRHTPPQ